MLPRISIFNNSIGQNQYWNSILLKDFAKRRKLLPTVMHVSDQNARVVRNAPVGKILINNGRRDRRLIEPAGVHTAVVGKSTKNVGSQVRQNVTFLNPVIDARFAKHF